MVGMIGGSQSRYQIYQGPMPFQQMAGSIPGANSGGIPGIGNTSPLSGNNGIGSMSGMNSGGMSSMSAMPGMGSMGSMGSMSGMGNLGIAGSTLQLMSQISTMMASVMQGLMSFVQTLVASNQQKQAEQANNPGGDMTQASAPSTSGTSPGSDSGTPGSSTKTGTNENPNSKKSPGTSDSGNSSSNTSSSELYPDQTKEKGLLNSVGCGPIAAMAFLKKSGKNKSLKEVKDYAKSHKLWNTNGTNGMTSPSAEQALLKGQGVNSTMESGLNWNKIRDSVQKGKPVIISTPQHYWVVESYDPKTKKFNFGNSAKILKKQQQMTQGEYLAAASSKGAPTHAFYLND